MYLTKTTRDLYKTLTDRDLSLRTMWARADDNIRQRLLHSNLRGQ